MDAIQPIKTTTPPSQAKEILFPNGNNALSVTAAANTPASDVLNTLGFQQPKALIIVIGGANELDDSLKARLKFLCNLGIALVAAESEAAIIDGGTQAGIMEMIGQAVAERGHQSILLGVAPSGTVTYPGGPVDGSLSESAPLDPNHSHFVLVEGSNWGDETNTMYTLADELGKKIPVITILVDGGEIAKHEAWQTVQRRWPLIVIKGSGRTADAIATLWENKNTQRWNDASSSPTPELAEIIDKGDIHLFPLNGTIEQFEKLLKQLLYRTPFLSHAWELFALFDANAKRQREHFEKLQIWIVGVGVFVTAAVVLQVFLRSNKILTTGTLADQILHGIIVFLPIIVSILIAWASRFTPGNKWVLLRASAEAIKREIYRYRSGTGVYINDAEASAQSSSHRKPGLSPQENFSEKITGISNQLMQTEMNTLALRPYGGPIPPKMDGAEEKDDGYSQLTPDRYISIRIDDQLSYFRNRTNELSAELARSSWLIFIAGGLGTLLAALGLEPFVALTAALAAAFVSYLEYRQTQYTLVKYNQTLSSLNNVKNLWMAFPEDKRKENFDELVNTTEQILETENTGWVQQMHDALAALRARQEERTGDKHQHTGSRDDKENRTETKN
jgi:SLOG in TRPM, prokaryote/SMODS and SLOG-associating 2TM effector domain 1/Protein of unknown function (DUF4231)